MIDFLTFFTIGTISIISGAPYKNGIMVFFEQVSFDSLTTFSEKQNFCLYSTNFYDVEDLRFVISIISDKIGFSPQNY